jgi:hypothetical protein
MKTTIIITTIPGSMRVVHIAASGKEVFAGLLQSFKSQVPAKYRSYLKMSQGWSVSADGFAALDMWLADIRERRPRFEIVHKEIDPPQSESVDPLEAALADGLHLLEQLRESAKKSKGVPKGLGK